MSELLTLLSRRPHGVAAVREIYLAYRSRPAFVADAIAALRHADPDIAGRAAWVLDRAAREGRLDDASLTGIARAAEDASDWITRAHVCHIFCVMVCPTALRPTVFPILEDCFRDRHGSVCCWALTAMVRFGDDPRYASLIDRYVSIARADPRAATQARLRQLGIVPYPPRAPSKRRPHRRARYVRPK